MDDNAIWAGIDRQRVRITDLLEQLSEGEWRQPSLCVGWTVRDVAGHLALQQIGVGGGLRLLARHPGGINRMIREGAKECATEPTEQIIARIRAMIGSRRHAIGVTCRETLIDNLVHSQDIAVPLGRRLDIDPEAAAVAADRVWSNRQGWKAGVFKSVPLDGLRFTATDVAWSAGDGHAIYGPMSAILLTLTGRYSALTRLSGPGLDPLNRLTTLADQR